MPGVNNRNREYNDDPQAQKYCTLFLGGLNTDTTEETLKQHFGKWGDIANCVVKKCKKTKQSRCFGFITYKTAEMLDDAQNNRPHIIDYREVNTKRATPQGQSNESHSSVKKMFVGGLKADIAEDEILEVFGRFGNIEKLELIKDKKTGEHRGFCFITFDDFDSVDKCVSMQRISVGGKSVEMKKAVPKDQIDGMGGGRGGFRGGGRGGFGGGSNNGYDHQGNYGYPGNMGGNDGYGQGNYGYPGNMGGNCGHEGYGDWYKGDNDNGWGGNYFNDGYNNFRSGYGTGYGGGPTRSVGFSKKGAAPYKNGRGRGGRNNGYRR